MKEAKNDIKPKSAEGLPKVCKKDDLVKEFKDDGLWAQIIAAHPFIGGYTFADKFNLRDPVI